jgi:thioredoxin 1
MLFFLLAAVLTVTEDNFQSEVLESEIPVVVDVYADWCGHCKKVAPIFFSLSEEKEGEIKFVKLNVDVAPSLADQLEVEAYPTFIFYKDGKIVGRSGAMDKNGFNKMFQSVF